MKTKIVILFILLLTMSCRHSERNLTFIGLGEDGKSKSVSFGKEDYEEKLAPVMDQIYSETVSTLDQTVMSAPKWKIEKVEIGIAVTGTFGIGTWKVGATPGFRLMFRPKK
jgi:hypothetical protein